MLMILKISFLARSLVMDLQIVFFFRLKRKVKNEMAYCEYGTTPIWSVMSSFGMSDFRSKSLLLCTTFGRGENVQRLSNSMIMSSLFCPLEFFLP